MFLTFCAVSSLQWSCVWYWVFIVFKNLLFLLLEMIVVRPFEWLIYGWYEFTPSSPQWVYVERDRLLGHCCLKNISMDLAHHYLPYSTHCQSYPPASLLNPYAIFFCIILHLPSFTSVLFTHSFLNQPYPFGSRPLSCFAPLPLTISILSEYKFLSIP